MGMCRCDRGNHMIDLDLEEIYTIGEELVCGKHLTDDEEEELYCVD